MLNVFNRSSVYIGTDMNEFNIMRNLLEDNKIKYKYEIKDRMGQWQGQGTLRSRTGSFGQASEFSKTYEIFVHKDDMEMAEYLRNSIA